ncbi:MAG TPA: 2-amino-4-hydroxy-6-hydroxymethyldihydropteridine diphosphokinase [Kiritimatiellia bacterium]|nr:2-amino-4-hydroxy-6-hydroxymethyldihydropteridine diphosphokinase [Kiritimatiellia bacterium]
MRNVCHRPQVCESVLSLGSNEGDRLAWLVRARAALTAETALTMQACSPVYETDPVGVPDAFTQQRYLNQIVIVETDLSPQVFSQLIHTIEHRLGRTRGTERNLPRTLDIDIITFGDVRSTDPNLTLPHPRAGTRRFVLQPLADLRPDARLPGDTRTVRERLHDLPDTPRVTLFAPPGCDAAASRAPRFGEGESS